MMGDLRVHLPIPLNVQQFFKNVMTPQPVPHPPYSPNLSPSKFFFISLMKKLLKGKCFADVEEVTKNNRSIKSHQNQKVQKLF